MFRANLLSFHRAAGVAALAAALFAAPTARADFIAPRSFDFGEDKYRHTDDAGNWEILTGLPGSITYQPDAVRVAATSGGGDSFGLLTNFDNLGGGQRNNFIASTTFELQASGGTSQEWNRFQFWALGDTSLATGGSGNTGYVLHIRRGDREDQPALTFRSGGYGGTIFDSDRNFPVNVGDLFEFEIVGRYGQQGSVPGLFLDVSASNVTQDYSVEFDTYFDPNPHEGSGFGFGIRRHPSPSSATMDVLQFSVIPEPGTWLLLLSALACGLLWRRRR